MPTARPISQPGRAVKGRIIASGVSLGDVAEAAGISPQSLSDYLAGRSANPERQLAIYRAWCRLTGRAWSYEGLRDWWGELLTEASD